jgi:hypothetical protein
MRRVEGLGGGDGSVSAIAIASIKKHGKKSAAVRANRYNFAPVGEDAGRCINILRAEPARVTNFRRIVKC